MVYVRSRCLATGSWVACRGSSVLASLAEFSGVAIHAILADLIAPGRRVVLIWRWECSLMWLRLLCTIFIRQRFTVVGRNSDKLQCLILFIEPFNQQVDRMIQRLICFCRCVLVVRNPEPAIKPQGDRVDGVSDRSCTRDVAKKGLTFGSSRSGRAVEMLANRRVPKAVWKTLSTLSSNTDIHRVDLVHTV